MASQLNATANFSCPKGGSWFACTGGSRFLGCCKSNPCSRGCSDDDLEPASFNSSYAGAIYDQECGKGNFFTCRDTNPPFLGCCKDNPCQKGNCPSKDLFAASLSDNTTAAAAFTGSTTLSSTITTSSAPHSTSFSSISSTSSLSIIAIATTVPASSSHSTLSGGAIAGIASGGVIALLALSAIIVAMCQRRDKRDLPVYRGGFGETENDPMNKVSNASWYDPASFQEPRTTELPSFDVPRTPNQTNPRYSFDALSPARTDLSAHSLAVSSLAPSPEPYANQWAPLFSGRAVSGRTASSMNDRGPELDVINIGYQSRDSPVSAAPSSWDTHSRYASNGGISYVAYRPSA